MAEPSDLTTGPVLRTGMERDEKRLDDLWNRPGYLVRRLHQIHVGLFAEEFANSGVTPVQYAMLSVLGTHTTMDQLSLSKAVGVDRTSGADVIKRLARQNLVIRTTSPDDRRMKLVAVTPAGAALVREMRPAMQAAQDRMMAPLQPEERKFFMDALCRMIEANNSASRAPMT